MTDTAQGATREPLLLAKLSSPETGDLLPEIGLVLIPVGAHEQHGPSIAVSTDTVSADALCRAAAAIAGPRVAVAPAIPWGISWHHMRFPGTIALRPATLIALLEDIVGSLHAHGVERVLIVNGHGGNSATIGVAIDQIKQATGIPLLASVFGYALIAEQARALLPAGAIGHAGADEASVVMAVDAALGKSGALAPADLTGNQAESAALLGAYGGALARPFHEITRNGATGDATLATAELGRQILDGAAQRLVEIIEVLLREASEEAENESGRAPR
jgi:creatinine amidohydrolase